jgi:hypothetical protein
MNQYYLIALLGLAIVLTIQCKKDKHTSAPDIQYQAMTTASVGPVRMYTHFGEVTNKAVIQDFISRMAIGPNTFLLNSTSESFNPSSLKIAFHNESSARVERYSFSASSSIIEKREAEILRVSDSVILVREIDSLPTIVPNPVDYCGTIALNVLLFPPQRSCLPTSSSISQCKFKNSFPLIKRGNDYELPYMVMLFGSGFNGCSFHAYGSVWNMLNTATLSNFSFNDTLVVQTKRVVLKKE